MDTDEYKKFIRDGYRPECKSPLVMLKDQRNNYKATHGLARGSSAICSPKVPPF